MALPQQLEALMGDEGADGDDGDELAAEWLDKVGHFLAGQICYRGK